MLINKLMYLLIKLIKYLFYVKQIVLIEYDCVLFSYFFANLSMHECHVLNKDDLQFIIINYSILQQGHTIHIIINI